MADLDEHAKAGIEAINEQRFDDAIKSFQAALELGPDRPDMNNALGMAYMHRGEVYSALPHLERAVALSDDYPDAEHVQMKVHFLTSLATAYQMADDVAGARKVLEDTVARFPDQLDPRLQLGQLLLTSCLLEDGLAVYESLTTFEGLDEHGQKAARAVVDSARALQSSPESPKIFLEAHRDSYASYFDDIASEQPEWYAEAARMAKDDAGELQPILAAGARQYAMSRVDLVNPKTGEVAGIYSDTEPMIVAVEGVEPLAQLPIMFPVEEYGLELWVCSQVPWHWLQITIQFEQAMPFEERDALIDPVIARWYLAGYNGDFGEKDAGRFHYITDPAEVGERGIAYTVDLGRAKYAAVEALLEALLIVNATHPIRRVLFGNGYLPD